MVHTVQKLGSLQKDTFAASRGERTESSFDLINIKVSRITIIHFIFHPKLIRPYRSHAIGTHA